MNTAEMQNNPEHTRISKIHFLVHPGYLTAEGERLTTDDATTKYEPLFDLYFAEAAKLKDDELMIAFTHTSKSEYAKDIRSNLFYIKKLQELKKILNKRLIILSTDVDPFSNPEVIETIQRIASLRGYTFDKDVASDAYGETLGVCVNGIAQNVNSTGNLSHKTKIRPKLTDAHDITKEQLDQLRQQIENEHDRLTF